MMEKSSNSDCFGIAYEVHDTMCIQCGILNECKKESIRKNKPIDLGFV